MYKEKFITTDKKYKLKFIFLISIIFFLPFLDFVNNNFKEINIIIGTSFYLLIFLQGILLIIISFLIFFIFKDKINLWNCLLISTIINWFFFKHHLLKLEIQKILKNEYSSELSLFLIILFTSLVVLFLLKKNRFIEKFVNIFFIILFILTSLEVFNKLYQSKNQFEKNSNTKMNFIYRDNLKLEKENIYYFILDGMQPIEGFENFYDVELKEFLSFVEKNKYKHIKNSENYYGNTKHDISALFYLDKIFLNREKAIFKENTNIIFPTLMRHTEKSNLMVNLKNLGYNFKWLGNFFAYCPKYNLRFCLDKKKKFFIDSYLYINFFRQTPIIQITWKVASFFNYDFNKNFFYKLNDGIGRLHSHLEKNDNLVVKNKPTFYFTHHMSPHWPYLTNSNCTYKFSPGRANVEGYKNAYLCNLNKIIQIINFLNLKDPNAIVVFQSDHNGELTRHNPEEKKKIFNLVKLGETCLINDSINMSNINTMRLILSCITGNKVVYLNN